MLIRKLAVLTFIAAALGAQSPTLPPVRTLAAPVATSAKTFGRVVMVRALPGGRLLVNDPGRRELVLTDTAFRSRTIIADTTQANETQYGPRAGGLLPWPGDSSVFVEVGTPLMYLIDPAGKVARMTAVPIPRDAPTLSQNGLGSAASTDSRGRLVYRSFMPRNTNEPKTPPGELHPYSNPDSAPIIRVDPTTRRAETIAWYRMPKSRGVRFFRADGSSMVYIGGEALAVVDDFAMLSDGTLAVLRADYRLDLIGPDGTMTSTPKIPYAWERMTDEGKVALVDSIAKARDAATRPPASSGAAGSSSIGSGGMSGGGGPPVRPGDPDPEFARSLIRPRAEDVPDYRPAFGRGSAFADANGNLWIRTLQPAPTPDHVVYDVVARTGKLLDRIQMPRDRPIVGFDRNAVYVLARDESVAWLERVRF